MKNWHDHHTGVSTIAIRTRQPHNPKIAIELPPLPPKEKLFFKISPSKIFKTSNAQATQKDQKHNSTMTAKLTADNDYTTSTDRRPAYNNTYKKLAVQWLNEVLCFVSSSVVADSFRLRNRQLLVAANRYVQLF